MAFAFVLFAFIFELLFQRLFPYPFLLLFFAAGIASGWFGGTRAGLFALLLSMLAVDYSFVPPVSAFIVSASALAYLIAFILCAFGAAAVSLSMKRSQEAIKSPVTGWRYVC
jgi:K+-sensing histidine kinase KdpD